LTSLSLQTANLVFIDDEEPSNAVGKLAVASSLAPDSAS
jgi:hypothetical protein